MAYSYEGSIVAASPIVEIAQQLAVMGHEVRAVEEPCRWRLQCPAVDESALDIRELV
jgi:hypothetical protein